MPDYAKLYAHLFNRITDVIEELKKIQLESEEMFMESRDEDESTDPE